MEILCNVQPHKHYMNMQHQYSKRIQIHYAIIVSIYVLISCNDRGGVAFAFSPNKGRFGTGPNLLSQTSLVQSDTTTSAYRSDRHQTFLPAFHFENDDESEMGGRRFENDDKPEMETETKMEISDNQRRSEFEFEARPRSPKHEKRLQYQQLNEDTFVPYGKELWKLRSTLVHLNKQLIHAIAKSRDSENDKSSSAKQESSVSVEDIRDMIREVESKDPEFMYALAKENMEVALKEDRLDDAKGHEKRALAARSMLPHFNLHGLWVGKYGDQGFEMVNVTYAGDTLLARKVTGDENVPAGEISFQADLSPPKANYLSSLKNTKNDKQPLPNIKLTEAASKKWNTEELPRFAGLGQVAEKGFRTSQWMDGQLVFLNDDYFSFAWMPLKYQIVFGRPSIELTVQMMKEQRLLETVHRTQSFDEEDEELCILPPDLDDDPATLNQHVVNCFDATQVLIDECSIQGDSESCIFNDDPDSCCFE